MPALVASRLFPSLTMNPKATIPPTKMQITKEKVAYARPGSVSLMQNPNEHAR